MPATIGIHGAAGAVGSAAALALVMDNRLTPDGLRLVLADAAAPQLACLEMDLEMLTAARPRLAVERGDLAALAACDVVVACAGVPHRDGEPREAFLEENAAILTPLADALDAPDARCRAVVLVTNPVDELAAWLRGRLGERVRVLGHALNDTLRLRVAIARVRGCGPHEVVAWSAGGHGPHAVPQLDRVHVRGVPVALTAAEQAAVRDELTGWYGRWQAHGTGRTSALASGWGAALLVRMVLRGEAQPLAATAATGGAPCAAC